MYFFNIEKITIFKYTDERMVTVQLLLDLSSTLKQNIDNT